MKSAMLQKQKQKQSKDVASSLQIIRSKSQKIYSFVKEDVKSLKPIRQPRQKTYNINANLQLLPSPRLTKQRESEALKLSRNISEKIHRDNRLKMQFVVEETQHRQRKDQLTKKIEQINRRNKLRLKELQQFQQRFIKKLTIDYQKDSQIQRRLKSQYQQMQKKQIKIKAKKIATDIIQKQAWKQITQQKNKIGSMIDKNDRYKNKQIQEQANKILNPKKSQQTQQKTKAKIEKKKQFSAVQEKKSPQNVKKNANSKDLKLLNIKLKNIDYVPEIVQKIARKSGNLSKVNPNYHIKKANQIEESSVEAQPQSKLPQIPKDDGQIGEYLKQIRNNIQELDELHRQ